MGDILQKSRSGVGRDEDGIDSLDDTVVGHDIGDCDRGVLHPDDRSGSVYGEVFALQGPERRYVLEIGERGGTVHDVVEHDVLTVAGTVQDRFADIGVHPLECIIGRGEHRVWSRALKRGGDAGRPEEACEQGEVPERGGLLEGDAGLGQCKDFHDVFGGVR